MQYKYPLDLVNSLYSFPKETIETLFPIPVPKHLIKQLLEIAYHASFLTEEERQTRFKIAVISRDRVGHNPRKTEHEMTVIEFNETRDLSVVELMRLSPATDFTSTLICVDAMEYIPGKAKQNLKIWGVVSTGNSIKKLLRLQTDHATHLPTCLVVSSIAPGHIQLAQNINPLITLRNGKISIVPRKTSALPKMIVSILEKGCKSFAQETQKDTGSPNVFFELRLELICKKYIEIFCKLLIALSDSYHGSTLLFVPYESNNLNEVLSIKYKTKFQRIKYLFQDYFAESFSQDDSESIGMPLKRLDSLLDETLAIVSRTSSVDGAIVINDRFELLGFGAEILAKNDDISRLHFSIGQTETKYSSRSVTDYGTRHRSAARFTKALPGSIAFVISQDGEKKLITTKEEKVIVYSNIIWDKMWESIELIA